MLDNYVTTFVNYHVLSGIKVRQQCTEGHRACRDPDHPGRENVFPACKRPATERQNVLAQCAQQSRATRLAVLLHLNDAPVAQRN